MDYNLDQLSSMLLGDLELFPECLLDDGPAKIHSADSYKGHEPKFVNAGSTPALDDDEFPDWLDLKMDMSLLEGLETPDVLDDLLLGEVVNGQSLDSLPALQTETKTLLPLDLEQLPYEQAPDTIPSPQAVACGQATPPSSPEWQVPDVSSCSPASFFSPVSEPTSPSYVVASPPPAPIENTLITFVASGVPSFSLTAATEVFVSSPSLSLDLLGSQLSLESENVCEEIIQHSPAQSDVSSSEQTFVVVTKTRRKKKAVRNQRTSPTKSQISIPSESSSDDIGFPVPSSKKERKRKQNKDAAMRYRIKKRLETDVMAEEENLLLDENKKLKDKVKQISSELGYLKNLMREMFKAKGLMK